MTVNRQIVQQLFLIAFMVMSPVRAQQFDRIQLYYEYYPLGPGLVPAGMTGDVDRARYVGWLSVLTPGNAVEEVCFADSTGAFYPQGSQLLRPLLPGDSLLIPFRPGGMEVVLGGDHRPKGKVKAVVDAETVLVALRSDDAPEAYVHNAHLNCYHHFNTVAAWVTAHDLRRVYESRFARIQLDYEGDFGGTRFNFRVSPPVFEFYQPAGAALFSDVIYHEYAHMIHNQAGTPYFIRDRILRGSVTSGITESLPDYVAYTLNHHRDAARKILEGCAAVPVDFEGTGRLNDQMQDDLRLVFDAMLAQMRLLWGAETMDPLAIGVMGSSKTWIDALIDSIGAEAAKSYSLRLTDMAEWFLSADEILFNGCHCTALDSLLKAMHILPPGVPGITVRALADGSQREESSLVHRVHLAYTPVDSAEHYVLNWQFRDRGFSDTRNWQHVVPTRQLLIRDLAAYEDMQVHRLFVDNVLNQAQYDPYLHFFQIMNDPGDGLFIGTGRANYYDTLWIDIERNYIDEAGLGHLQLHFPPSGGDSALYTLRLGAVWEGLKEAGWSLPDSCLVWGPGAALSGVLSGDAAMPAVFVLHQNYPNPFNPLTAIPYELGQKSPVVMDIYDSTGRRVRPLVCAVQNRGKYTAVWDGKLIGGEKAASGVYFITMRAGTFYRVMKVLLLK